MAGPLLHIDDSAGKLGTVDVENSVVKIIGDTGRILTDIAFNNAGNLFSISFDQLFSANKSTAATTLIGNYGSGISLNSLVFDANGTLYAANNSLYSIDTSTGRANSILSDGNNPVSYNSSGDLAFVAGGLFLSSAIGADSLVRIDPANGAGTAVSSIGCASVFGLTSNDNINLFSVSGTEIPRIDTSTGAGAAVLNYAGRGLSAANGPAFFAEARAVPPVTDIPEPASIALLCLGLLACAAPRGKSRK